MPLEEEITEIHILDTARILNQAEEEWEKAWISTIYRRHKKKTPVKNKEVAADEVFLSDGIFCEPFSKMSVFVKTSGLAAGSGADIKYETSMDGAFWYQRHDDAVFMEVTKAIPDMWRMTDIAASYIRFEIYPWAGGDGGIFTIDAILIS